MADQWWLANTCDNSTVSTPKVVFLQFYSIIYAVPTTFLYLFVIYALKKQSGYYSLVYTRLFILCCALNMICWWLEVFFSLIIGFPPICPLWISFSGYYYLSVLYFLYACFPLANFMCTTAISIYQMAGIVFPVYSEQIFKKRSTIILLLIFVIPIVACVHILYSRMTIVPLSHSRTYMLVQHFSKALDFITVSLVNFIAGAIGLIIIFVSCLISIIRYSRLNQNSSSSVKLRLFLINLYICLSTAIFIIYQVLIYFSNFFEYDYSVLEMIYSYRTTLADLCYLPLPWITLIINRRIRKFLFRRGFCCSSSGSPVTVFGSSHTGRISLAS